MSAAPTTLVSPIGPRSAIRLAPLTLGLGLALLLMRPWMPTSRVVANGLLLLTYAGLGAIALSAPLASPGRRLVHPVVVVLVGLGAVWVVARASGPPGPAAWDAVALSVGAAVAEEAFFRRFVYGWLLRWGVVAACAGSAVAFALVHVPAYGAASIWVNLGAGGLFAWQRWASGGWGSPAATHAAANVLAVLP